MKALLTLLTFVLFINFAYTQGVGVNETGSAPDASAILHVESESGSKGVLLSRLTTVQRDGILMPANGLLIYNTDTECFNYYATNVWVSLCGVELGLGGCPSGFVQINDQFSIEIDQRSTTSWFNAIQICESVGGRLCNWSEWYTACTSGAPLISMVDSFWEWVDDGTGDNTVLAVGRLNCTASNSQATSLSTPFRCCCDH